MKMLVNDFFGDFGALSRSCSRSMDRGTKWHHTPRRYPTAPAVFSALWARRKKKRPSPPFIPGEWVDGRAEAQVKDLYRILEADFQIVAASELPICLRCWL